jgi:phosphoribosylamine--glycine ligase
MRVLVIGSGGREHALVWKLRQSPSVQEVFCSPGNAGIAKDARCVPLPPPDHAALTDLARKERIDCVIVGPEAPLAAGLADRLQTEGIPVVGPRQNAAKLEASKVFAKEFMQRHGIPTAPFSVHANPDDALKRIGTQEVRYPIVMKADGLAAGKGVIIARAHAEALEAVHRIMVEREFGSAGDRIVLEDFLEGVEASFIVFTDGQTIVPAVAARDHKAAYDNDSGPNTGGMGAYSTDGILGAQLEKTILERIICPVIDGMRAEGTPFQGMLYAGLMICNGEPYVLEFNVRMGDPEGQVILPRLQSDFGELCEGLCQRRLYDYKAVWQRSAAVCVVLASGGYPGSYAKGQIISGLKMAEEDDRIVIFHSGTRREGDNLVTDGGRVLGVTATGPDLASTVMSAYEAVNKIHFEGMHYRRDIGAKGLQQIQRQQ